jgi:hypothetical protein
MCSSLLGQIHYFFIFAPSGGTVIVKIGFYGLFFHHHWLQQ